MTHVMKKVSIAIMVAVFVATMSLSMVILPSKVYADDPTAGCSVWVEISQQTSSTWDILIYPTTSGPAEGLKYRIGLDGTPIYHGTVPVDNWDGDSFPASGLTAGTHEVILGVDTQGDNIYASFTFSLWDHKQWIEISPSGETITWHATNSDGRTAELGVLRMPPDDPNNSIDQFSVLITSNNDLAYTKHYSLTPGTYVAYLGIDGYWSSIDWDIAAGSKAKVEPVWVRTGPMVCSQVWINEDNKFQFIFWYPYRDNNWVRIYDMSGKMVYEIDMPYDNPNLIVDLPDGMYTVKTFTVGSTEPIQTFVIGKP